MEQLFAWHIKDKMFAKKADSQSPVVDQYQMIMLIREEHSVNLFDNSKNKHSS